MPAEEPIGRASELTRIDSFLDAARGGLHALAITGPAGIGKTTLWEAVRAGAEERGYTVLSSRPVPGESGLAFAGLGDLFVEVSEDTISQLPDPQRRALDIALLRADASGPRPDQRAVSVATAGLLRRLSEHDRPVLVAVDDAQWLDESSGAILAFALRRVLDRPIGIALTVRTGEVEDTPAVGAWVQEDRLERLPVGPLPLAALHRLFLDRLGLSFSRFALLRIEQVSGGNPFYALEIARALIRSGASVAPGELLPVPETLTGLMGERIGRLPAKTRHLLLLVAAAIDPSLETLTRTGVPDPQRTLRPAIRQSIVAVDGQAVRFTHPLLAQCVLASADPALVRGAHAALAESAASEEVRARHLGHAADGPDEGAAAALEEASGRAGARGAIQAAAELAELAATLTPLDRSHDRWRRSLAEAEFTFEAGSAKEARRLIERTIAEMPHGSARASASLLLAKIVTYGDDAAALALMEDALDEAGDDPGLQARIRTEMAWAVPENFASAIAHADAAIALLDEERDPGQLAQALSAKMFLEFVAGQGARLDLGERAVELERRSQPVRVGERADFWLGITLKNVDRLDEARVRLSAVLEAAVRDGDDWGRAEVLNTLDHLEYLAGRWETAERYLWEKLEFYEVSGHEHGPRGTASTAAILDVSLGRLDRARVVAAEALRLNAESEDPWSMLNVLPGAGFVELSGGDDRAAEGFLSRADEMSERLGLLEPNRLRFHADLVEVLVRLGELDRAEAVLERFASRASANRFPWSLATSARCRGVLDAAHGDLDAATAALEAALLEHRRLPEPFELARTLLVKGQIHRRRKEKRQAADALHEALRIFEELGAPLWATKARAELGRVGLRPRAPSELTATEQRVAELAAKGLSSREIADVVFLAPKTVSNVLGRVYRKLGIRSRAELGALMTMRSERSGDGADRAQRTPAPTDSS